MDWTVPILSKERRNRVFREEPFLSWGVGGGDEEDVLGEVGSGRWGGRGRDILFPTGILG